LNLGVHFDLPKEQWKDLSNCIEEIITGQKSLIDYPKEIKTLARRYSRKLFVSKLLLLMLEKIFLRIMRLLISTALRMRRPGQLELNMLFMRLSRNLG